MNTTIKTTKVNVSKLSIISDDLKAQIIAQYEAEKLAQYEAEKLEIEKQKEIKAKEIEAKKLSEIEAKKREQKEIRDAKKDIDNSMLNDLLKPTELLKHINAKYSLNKDVDVKIWYDKLISLNLVKQLQKDVINFDQMSELIKSLQLVFAQMSNDDLNTFDSDGKKMMPSKYLTLIVNGACKSKKAFQNSKDKLKAFNDKKAQK